MSASARERERMQRGAEGEWQKPEDEVAAAAADVAERTAAAAPGGMSASALELLPGKWSMNLVKTNPEAVRTRRKDGGQVSDNMKTLPAWKTRGEILTSIRTNQVTIISGDTGCGKSTLIPQIIADATSWNEDDRVILCVQ